MHPRTLVGNGALAMNMMQTLRKAIPGTHTKKILKDLDKITIQTTKMNRSLAAKRTYREHDASNVRKYSLWHCRCFGWFSSFSAFNYNLVKEGMCWGMSISGCDIMMLFEYGSIWSVWCRWWKSVYCTCFCNSALSMSVVHVIKQKLTSKISEANRLWNLVRVRRGSHEQIKPSCSWNDAWAHDGARQMWAVWWNQSWNANLFGSSWLGKHGTCALCPFHQASFATATHWILSLWG